MIGRDRGTTEKSPINWCLVFLSVFFSFPERTSGGRCQAEKDRILVSGDTGFGAVGAGPLSTRCRDTWRTLPTEAQRGSCECSLGRRRIEETRRPRNCTRLCGQCISARWTPGARGCPAWGSTAGIPGTAAGRGGGHGMAGRA